jgi:hypothetical protein
MDCQKVNEYLDGLMGREIPPDHKEEVLAHFAKCPDCRQMYELDHALAAMPVYDMPFGLDRRISASIRGRERRNYSRYLAIAAALLLTLALLYAPAFDRVPVVRAFPEGVLVQEGKQLVLPAGATYSGDLQAYYTDVVVAGRLQGNIAVIGGRVEVLPGGQITGVTYQESQPTLNQQLRYSLLRVTDVARAYLRKGIH